MTIIDRANHISRISFQSQVLKVKDMPSPSLLAARGMVSLFRALNAGMQTAQVEVFLTVATAPAAGIYTQDILVATGMTAGSLSRNLAALGSGRLGLIQERTCPGNATRKYYSLTDGGRFLVNRITSLLAAG